MTVILTFLYNVKYRVCTLQYTVVTKHYKVCTIQYTQTANS